MSRIVVACVALAATVGGARALVAAGRVSMTLSGAKSASVEMRDAGYCVTTAARGKTTMHVFAVSASNKAWAVTIGSTSGLPAARSHTIDVAHTGGVTARLVDRESASTPDLAVRYEASAGTVTFSRVDSAHVAGSFKFTARPAWPAPEGKTLTADGTFDAPALEHCARPAETGR